MGRSIIVYGAGLAAAAFALEWLEYRYVARAFAAEAYIAIIALLFAGAGLWAGARLFSRVDAAGAFAKNEAALKALGVTAREYETLELLAEGLANKEIARALGVSPNTVKTHLARLYEKLGARRRTEALAKARALCLIP